MTSNEFHELNYINTRLKRLNSMHVFNDMLVNSHNSEAQNSQSRKSLLFNESNFINVLDQRINKIENMNNHLKGLSESDNPNKRNKKFSKMSTKFKKKFTTQNSTLKRNLKNSGVPLKFTGLNELNGLIQEREISREIVYNHNRLHSFKDKFPNKNSITPTIEEGRLPISKQSVSLKNNVTVFPSSKNSILNLQENLTKSNSMAQVKPIKSKNSQVTFQPIIEAAELPSNRKEEEVKKPIQRTKTKSMDFPLASKKLKYKKDKVIEDIQNSLDDAEEVVINSQNSQNLLSQPYSSCSKTESKLTNDTLAVAKKFMRTVISKDSDLLFTDSNHIPTEDSLHKDLAKMKAVEVRGSVAFKRQNDIVMERKSIQFDKLTPEEKKIAIYLQKDNPEMHKAIFNINNEQGRRKVMYLNDRKDVQMFIGAIKNKLEDQANRKYTLVRPNKTDKILKNGSQKLKYIYKNCEQEIRISEELKDILKKAQKKQSSNYGNINSELKELQQKQDMYLKGEKPADPYEIKKVFIYNVAKGGLGEVIGQSEEDKFKVNLVANISDNLAYANKDFFMSSLKYDFKDDPDFIFRDEMMQREKVKDKKNKKMITNNSQKFIDKHNLVEEILDNTFKGKDKLITKVTDLLNKQKEKESNPDRSDYFKDQFPLDLSVKQIFNKTKSGGISMLRNRSMQNLDCILPRVYDSVV